MNRLNVKGTSIFYQVEGNGIPIVFIHPPVLTSVIFKYQLEGLSSNLQVITFDIRGHGRSEFSSLPITYPLIIQDITKLLDHLNIEKAIICGYSTGASIALEFLLSFPERTLGGIIISGMPDVDDIYLRNKITLGSKLASKGAKSVLAWSMSWSNSDTLPLFKTMVKEASRGKIENMEQYFRYSMEYNCTSQLKHINKPMLLVFGKKDKPFFKYASILQKNLPDNHLYFINESHRIPTKAAKELNQLIIGFVHTNF